MHRLHHRLGSEQRDATALDADGGVVQVPHAVVVVDHGDLET